MASHIEVICSINYSIKYKIIYLIIYCTTLVYVNKWSICLITYQFGLYFQNQAQSTELHIIKEFEKHYQFLRKEEEAKIVALREEKEQKSRDMERKIIRVHGQITMLLEKIDTVKSQMESDDIVLLQVLASSLKSDVDIRY